MASSRTGRSGNVADKLAVGRKNVVRGRVVDADGHPVSRLLVKAFDRTVGTDDRLLGQSLTDAGGAYFITYNREPLLGGDGADLVICLYRNAEKIGICSDVIFDATPETIKDFCITTSPYQFDRPVADIEPLRRNAKGGKTDGPA